MRIFVGAPFSAAKNHISLIASLFATTSLLTLSPAQSVAQTRALGDLGGRKISTLDSAEVECRGLEQDTSLALGVEGVLELRNLRRRMPKQLFWYATGVEVLMAPRQGDSLPLLERIAACEFAQDPSLGLNLKPDEAERVRFELRQRRGAYALRLTSDRRKVARKLTEAASLRFGAR